MLAFKIVSNGIHRLLWLFLLIEVSGASLEGAARIQGWMKKIMAARSAPAEQDSWLAVTPTEFSPPLPRPYGHFYGAGDPYCMARRDKEKKKILEHLYKKGDAIQLLEMLRVLNDPFWLVGDSLFIRKMGFQLLLNLNHNDCSNFLTGILLYVDELIQWIIQGRKKAEDDSEGEYSLSWQLLALSDIKNFIEVPLLGKLHVPLFDRFLQLALADNLQYVLLLLKGSIPVQEDAQIQLYSEVLIFIAERCAELEPVLLSLVNQENKEREDISWQLQSQRKYDQWLRMAGGKKGEKLVPLQGLWSNLPVIAETEDETKTRD